jgi:hypothetical protein
MYRKRWREKMVRTLQQQIDEAPWILKVVFPTCLLEDVEHLLDEKSGTNYEVKQCWGKEEGDRTVFLYSYCDLQTAMEKSKKMDRIGAVESVDVYDVAGGVWGES